MADHTPDLVDRLASSEETGLDPALLVPLLKLLANGEPVAVDELAAATGRTVEEIRKGLAAVPDTEYDADGRIVGQGLTLRATSHRFSVEGPGTLHLVRPGHPDLPVATRPDREHRIHLAGQWRADPGLG